MEQTMFCFQCEQTAGCAGCTGKAGVCGKRADTAGLQDQLTGKLIGLARAVDGNWDELSDATNQIVREGLFATITNVNFDNAALTALIHRAEEAKRQIIPMCYECVSACGKNNDYDMKQLLEQTAGKGINIYTHGEMLPAHGYPELVHIGPDKDFTPVIDKALALGGYPEETRFTGINGGGKAATGYGRHAVLSVANQVVEAVKTGAVRHFFLVGGCNGARPGRSYYTGKRQIAEYLPP